MERWFKSHGGLHASGMADYDQMAGLVSSSSSASIIRSTTLASAASVASVSSDDFSHPCLGDKGLGPLELLTTDEEGVPSIIELEVQMDGKCFSEGPHEETTVLSNEETILFEEVRDTPSVLHQDEREASSLPSIQSKVVVEERITLLTKHELESMRVMSAPESDSDEGEEGVAEDTSELNGCVGSSTEKNGTKLKPLVVVHDNETLYLCPIEECSRGFPKLFLAKSHIMTHVGVRQFKVFCFLLQII